MAMTDEERNLLIDRLFYPEIDQYTNLVDIDPLILKDAANEIERLAARVQKLEQELELALDEKRFAND
jgi:HAMP domain-containing protein